MWVQNYEKTSSERKNYIWDPSTCTYKNGKYSESIIGDSAITCDRITGAWQKLLQQKLFQQNLLQQISLFYSPFYYVNVSKFIEQICIIYRPEEKQIKKWLMVAKKVSVDVKTKNTFKYDYFPGFLLYLKMHNLKTIETPKEAKNS